MGSGRCCARRIGEVGVGILFNLYPGLRLVVFLKLAAFLLIPHKSFVTIDIDHRRAGVDFLRTAMFSARLLRSMASVPLLSPRSQLHKSLLGLQRFWTNEYVSVDWPRMISQRGKGNNPSPTMSGRFENTPTLNPVFPLNQDEKSKSSMNHEEVFPRRLRYAVDPEN